MLSESHAYLFLARGPLQGNGLMPLELLNYPAAAMKEEEKGKYTLFRLSSIFKACNMVNNQ